MESRRTEGLHVRVTKRERERLEAEAAAAGVRLSELMRARLLGARLGAEADGRGDGPVSRLKIGGR